MKINSIKSNLSFQRALTTAEKKEFVQVTNQARRALGLDNTTATIFDFSVPTKTKDTGIGTTFSTDAQELAQMLKTMCGVNSIQLGPQGEISNYVRSPYSGTNFSLGSHLIDLKKLKNDEYGNLLNERDFKAPLFNRTKDDEKVNYENIYSTDGQEAALKTAFFRFNQLNPKDPLKKEFEQFKKENSYWLERDALYEAAAVENGSKELVKWNLRDQNVFATPHGDQKHFGL